MKVRFTADAMRDLGYWEAANPGLVTKINSLIGSIESTPFKGLGKPEPLKNDWSGWWSRRITDEHRLVYRIHDGAVEIARCRFHYKK